MTSNWWKANSPLRVLHPLHRDTPTSSMREFGASSVPLGGTCNFMIRDSLAIVSGYFDHGRCPLVGCPVADSDMEAADEEKRRFKSGDQCYLLAAPRTASAELLAPALTCHRARRLPDEKQFRDRRGFACLRARSRCRAGAALNLKHTSAACRNYFESSERAHLEWKEEVEFSRFEAQF